MDTDKNINIEGITLSPEMIRVIKGWQEPGGLEFDLSVVDDAISIIAIQSEENSAESGKESLRTISSLCFFKKMLYHFMLTNKTD